MHFERVFISSGALLLNSKITPSPQTASFTTAGKKKKLLERSHVEEISVKCVTCKQEGSKN